MLPHPSCALAPRLPCLPVRFVDSFVGFRLVAWALAGPQVAGWVFAALTAAPLPLAGLSDLFPEIAVLESPAPAIVEQRVPARTKREAHRLLHAPRQGCLEVRESEFERQRARLECYRCPDPVVDQLRPTEHLRVEWLTTRTQ